MKLLQDEAIRVLLNVLENVEPRLPAGLVVRPPDGVRAVVQARVALGVVSVPDPPGEVVLRIPRPDVGPGRRLGQQHPQGRIARAPLIFMTYSTRRSGLLGHRRQAATPNRIVTAPARRRCPHVRWTGHSLPRFILDLYRKRAGLFHGSGTP